MWQSILVTILSLLPNIIVDVEALAAGKQGAGPAKQAAVLNLIGSGVAIAGVSDPKQANLIVDVAKAAVPSVVEMFNAFGWPGK